MNLKLPIQKLKIKFDFEAQYQFVLLLNK